ncbi:MAG: D-alanyl-D-alanine carboxypeptidase/D-alanyl-D-alanine endopeptidase [Planctomycetota bacterium]
MIRTIFLIIACAVATPGTAASISEQYRTIPSGAAASIAVLNCTDGTWLVAHRSHETCRMASLTKLFVSAAALLELGPDFTFRTRVHAHSPIIDGQIDDLSIVGGGSPCLDEHFSDKDPDTIFRDWANQISAAGISRINGDVIIDGSLFSGPIRPPTYPDDARNAQQWYSAPASALAFNDNCIDVRAVPTTPGQPARIETRPSSPRISISNRTTSVSSGGRKGIHVTRAHHANSVTVTGSYSATTSWFPLAIHSDPDLLAGDHLAHIWRQQGLTINGTVRRGHADLAGPVLLEHRDPLLDALTILNTRSQNFYGEQILRVLGARRHRSGSLDAGRRAVNEVLAEHLGTATVPHALLDGSGLSYGNSADAETVCRLLAAMHHHQLGPTYRTTLKERWHGHHRAQVKTGSLAVARCLAGYIDGSDGNTYAFAILLGAGDDRRISWASKTRDALFAAIVDRLCPP